MNTNEKINPLFRAKTGHTVKKSRSYRYDIYIYKDRSPSEIHFFQDDNLWHARRSAIHFYTGLILEKRNMLVELNFTGVFDGGDISVMELVSNAPNNPIAEKLYGNLVELNYVNHWMNTAAFEFDMYQKFGYNFIGNVENLNYGYMHPETGQFYGDINVLPGTGALYNHPGLITEVLFESGSSPGLKRLMNKQYQ